MPWASGVVAFVGVDLDVDYGSWVGHGLLLGMNDLD